MSTHETILSTTDRLEAQSVVSMLAAHGIEARLEGVVDSARLGIGDTALPLKVEVPNESVARAKELLAAAPDLQADDEPAERANRKRPIIAMGVPFVWPGLAHVYAGLPWTGVVLGLTVLASFLAARSVNVGGVYMLLVLADAVFGVRAVRAFNRGQHRSTAGQVAMGLGLSLAALALSSGIAAVSWVRHELAEREFGRYQLSCTAASLIIVNDGSEPRDLELKQVAVIATYGLFNQESVSATFPTAVLHLAPGARAEVPLTVDPGFPCAPRRPGLALTVDLDLRSRWCSTRVSLLSEGHEGTASCSHDKPAEHLRLERMNPAW